MSYGVLIPNRVASMNVDSYNRSAVSASDLENGMVVALTSGKSATAGETELWTAVQPATANLASGLWMIYSPELVLTISGSAQFSGIDPNPQNFINKATRPFDIFKLQVGDIFTITGDVITGTKSTNTYIVATDSDYQLNWAAAAISGLSCKLLGTTYISIPDGGVNSGRVTAYQFEVVALA